MTLSDGIALGTLVAALLTWLVPAPTAHRFIRGVWRWLLLAGALAWIVWKMSGWGWFACLAREVRWPVWAFVLLGTGWVILIGIVIVAGIVESADKTLPQPWWLSFTSADILGVHWIWRYSEERQIKNLEALCPRPECRGAIDLRMGGMYDHAFNCEACGRSVTTDCDHMGEAHRRAVNEILRLTRVGPPRTDRPRVPAKKARGT